MNPGRKRLKNLDRKEVRALAQKIARKYAQKDVIIGLVGQLGAGKTAFTKDFAAYFGIKKTKSPTFVIGSSYPIKSGYLHHYDFYRLNSEKQLEHLGLSEILNSRNRKVLIEWVDKFPKIAKQCDLLITFEVTGKTTRNVKIS